MARSARRGLILSLVCYCLVACLPGLAQPVPKVTLVNVPTEVLIGEPFTFTVVFENVGSAIGYGPFIDLVLESGGADLNSAGGPGDGITFVSAKMVAVNPPAPTLTSVVTPASWSAANCQYLGPLPHPYPEVVQGIVPPNANPVQVAPVVIAPLVGAQLVTIELPFGSFDPSQPAIVVEVTARVHEFADADPAIPTPLEIRARGGFRYGEDALNNPVPDYPILSHDVDSDQWVKTTVNPVVFTLKKEYLGPEDEAVAGPNFIGYYPLRYRITVDVADLQTIKYLQVTDNLPGHLQYADNIQVWINGSSASPCPAGSPPCQGCQPTDVAVSEPWPGPGGTLQVTLCDLITGHQGLPYEVVIEFDFYIPDAVLNADCDPCPVLMGDDVIAGGDWTPLDPRDSAVLVTSDASPVDHILQAKCMAIQKYVTPVGMGLVPGGTLRYELRFQVSDYHSIGGLKVLDQLSDGQRLLPTPAPVLTIQDQLGSYSTVVFPAEMPNPAVDCACCCCAAVGAVSGVTDLVFDVSGALVAADAASLPLVPRHQAGILTGGYATLPTSSTAAYGSIVFYVEIADKFFVNGANGQAPADTSVDKDDPINNCVRIDGEVYHNKDDANDVPTDVIGSANDTSFTCVILPSEALEKSVYAINGWFWGGGIPDVLPGDDVTFRIEYPVPSGDAENLTIRDWLPLPIFNVNDCNADMTADSLTWAGTCPCTPLGWIPATGEAGCGPTHTPPQGPNVCTSFQAPLLSPALPGNSISFDYDTMFDCSNTQKRIDLLFTLTVTHEPFADRLYLTNETQECELNTFGVRFCQTAIAQVHVREPELSIKKGVIATNNPYGEYGVYDPSSGNFTVGSAPTPTTTTPPTSCTPVPLSSYPIKHSTLGAFIDRDLRNVDADDWVTFAIAIENTGGAKAYEIELIDAFPLDAVDRPCCFEPCFDAGSISVTNGAGAAIQFTFAVGWGHVTIELAGPLDPLDSITATTGTNIAIITFNAKLLDADQMQSCCCVNRAELLRYTSAADTGSATYPNFVTAGFGGPFEDTAWVCVGPRAYAKCIEATSEAHTAPETAGSVPGVAIPNASNTVDATIGEIVRLRLVAVIPEGTTLGFQIRDLLPVGLTYVGNPKLAFVADMAVTSPQCGSLPTIYDDPKDYLQCPGRDLVTWSVPDVAVAPFLFGAGQDLTFFVHLNSAAPYCDIQNHDSDDNLELAIIEFNVQVDNVASNQDQPHSTLVNQFEVNWSHDKCCGNQAASRSDPVYVHIVEPVLTMTKTASPTLTQPSGTVTYTVAITNNGTADAFDIYFHDSLPSDLAPISGSVSCSGCSGSSAGILWQNIIATCPRLNVGHTITIAYQAIVSPTAAPCTSLTNSATVTWTSLPGPKGTPPGSNNSTGQQTVGPSGAATPPNNVVNGERNGSSVFPPAPPNSPNPPNDYSATASATVTVECPCVKAPDDMVAWWPLDETSGTTVQDIISGFDGTTWPGPITIVNGGGPATSASWPSSFMFAPGLVSNSLFFDLGQYIKVPHATALDPGTGDFTVDAWVIYAESGNGPRNFTIAKKGNSSIPGASWWHLYIRDRSPANATGELVFEVSSTSGTVAPAVVIAPAPPSGLGWHHVAATFKRGAPDTIVLYVDGTSATFPFVAGIIDPDIASTGDLYIAGGSQIQAIAIDEVEIFDRALDSNEVHEIFDADAEGKCKCVNPPSEMTSWWPGDGNANDIADGNDGTLQGNATFAPGKVDQAFIFAAATDYIDVPDAANLDFGPGEDLSIDAWILIDAPGSPTVLPIVDKREFPNNPFGPDAIGYSLFLYEGRLALQLADAANGFYNYISAGPDLRTLPPGWHHVAATVDRSSPTGGNLYVDGTAVLPFDPTNRQGDLANSAPLLIGRHADDSTIGFIGLIDEVEIFRRALSPQEVWGIFDASWAGKCKFCEPPYVAHHVMAFGPSANPSYVIEECVKRDKTASGVVDTYSYRVRNLTLQYLCAFRVQNLTTNTPLLPYVCSAGWTCSHTATWFEWTTTLPYAIAPGAYQDFSVSVNGPTVDVYLSGVLTRCGDGSYEVRTTGPGPAKGPDVPDMNCIESSDSRTRASDHGDVQVEACVTRSLDGSVNTYTYTVTNESFLMRECGMYWFSIPNPSGAATISQTGPEGWTAVPTRDSATGQPEWLWTAPARSCGLMPGASPVVFAVSIPAPSNISAGMVARVGGLDEPSDTAVGVITLGPL